MARHPLGAPLRRSCRARRAMIRRCAASMRERACGTRSMITARLGFSARQRLVHQEKTGFAPASPRASKKSATSPTALRARLARAAKRLARLASAPPERLANGARRQRRDARLHGLNASQTSTNAHGAGRAPAQPAADASRRRAGSRRAACRPAAPQQPGALELAQGLAHGRAIDLELPGELRLGRQRLAFLQLARRIRARIASETRR